MEPDKNVSKSRSGSKAKKEVLDHFSSQAIEEVEALTAEMLKKIGVEVSELASRTLNQIRKNPTLAIAAVITVGLVVAKMSHRSGSNSGKSTHH